MSRYVDHIDFSRGIAYLDDGSQIEIHGFFDDDDQEIAPLDANGDMAAEWMIAGDEESVFSVDLHGWKPRLQ